MEGRTEGKDGRMKGRKDGRKERVPGAIVLQCGIAGLRTSPFSPPTSTKRREKGRGI
jgi:hypothetical protein